MLKTPTALLLVFGCVSPCFAQTTTNCWRYSPQGVTCNSTTTPPAQFVAPQFQNPDILGSYIRGQQAANDNALARQQMQLNQQQIEMQAMQNQALKEQIEAQQAARRDHFDRLARFRRGFVRLTQCNVKQDKDTCAKQALSDPDYLAARDDYKAGIISASEIKDIVLDVQNSPPSQ